MKNVVLRCNDYRAVHPSCESPPSSFEPFTAPWRLEDIDDLLGKLREKNRSSIGTQVPGKGVQLSVFWCRSSKKLVLRSLTLL